jgi:phage-related protein
MDEILNTLPVLWVASSKRDFLEMPDDVVDDFGFGLYQAQKGKHPKMGKVLKGFGGASVVETDLIRFRLKLAEAMYKEWKTKRDKNG